jgi:hypothetical protein
MPEPVDLRGLDPPEPLLRILSALDSDAAGPLVFWLSREPYPLYPMIPASGWRHSVRREDTAVVLTVTRVKSGDPRDP